MQAQKSYDMCRCMAASGKRKKEAKGPDFIILLPNRLTVFERIHKKSRCFYCCLLGNRPGHNCNHFTWYVNPRLSVIGKYQMDGYSDRGMTQPGRKKI